jgi:hypothetical protein
MAAGSILFKLGRTLFARTLAEKAVEHLAGVITGVVNKPSPTRPVIVEDAAQMQIDGLKDTVRQHEERLSSLASALDGLRDTLRPLIWRSAVALWMALASVGISVAALIIAIRR